MLQRVHLFILILFLISPVLYADNILTEDIYANPDWQPEVPFKEADVTIPDEINLDDLQEFQVGADQPRFRYYIERGSLKTGTEGVTRFAVVIRSQSGATNSSYEGLRCGEREYKVFAYGSANKLFPAADSDWQTIPKDESTDYRAALYEDLICNLLTGQTNPSDAIFRTMRDNRSLNNF
ncbi:MAG: CNP1-like family protein [Candidatus Thiodiazotropha sp. (ex Lucinoma borealis)]|nr:CNP1-like family protein [Candidatus Thiodiazotropha sp. (ex Lucinoma borealis)]